MVYSNIDLHNREASIEYNKVQSRDPSLSNSDSHHYRLSHHDANASLGQKEEVTYPKATTYNEKIDPQTKTDLQQEHQPDALKGPSSDVVDPENAELGHVSSEIDARTHTFSGFYSKHRIFFHLFIWLFFTGYVLSELFQYSMV